MKLQGQKQKKLYTLSELKGIEKRISPIQVGENHASYARNFLFADGANRKRNGWRELYHFTDENDKDLRINGIYEYKEGLIIHAGEYLFNGDLRVGILADEKSCGFENNGLLYIVCGGELYIYNGSELLNAYDSIYSYIPLTTKSISPKGYEKTSVENEDANLLTPKRTNGLIGDKSERKKYRLDGKIDLSKPIEIKTRILTSLYSTEANVAPYNAIYKDSVRLTEENMEGVLGVDSEIAYDIFAGVGTEYNLGAIEEVSVFLKKPMKIENAIFEARDGFKVPRMSFYLGSELVYDMEDESEGDYLDLTDTLFGQTIDAINLYGSDNGTISTINIQGRKSYEGELEIIHRTDSISYSYSLKPYSIRDTEGKELTLYNNITGSHNQGAVIWIEKSIYNESLLVFNFCNVSPSVNESNIEITYSVCDSEKLKCNIADICKTDTGSEVLALSDGDFIYLSCGVGGFGYFPYSLKRKIGTDKKITALCGMSDFSLGVFKEDCAYYFVPEIKEGKTKVILRSYSTQGGSLSHFATKTVNLDTLSPQKDNIYGSLGTEGRVRRGSNIALDLKDKDLESSVAISYNGCYYLFVDGCVYVADTRYKIHESNRLDSSFEYEWWYLDGILASYVTKINNLIYIGREDGRIVSFYEGYSDIYYEKIHTGSFLLGENEEGYSTLCLNEELGIHSGDRILISSAYSYLGDILSKEACNGKLKLFLKEADFVSSAFTLRAYPNTHIYLKKENGELIEAIVEKADLYEHSLTLNLTANSDTYIGVLLKNEKSSYTLVENGDNFLLLDEFEKHATLCYTDNISLVCERRSSVECEYVTSAILNDSHTGKALYGLGVELLGDSQGRCEISYETDKSQNKKAYMLGSALDFDQLDFNSVSFNTSLQKSYTLRCFERSFDYLIIKIKHTEDKMLSLKCFLATYTEN